MTLDTHKLYFKGLKYIGSIHLRFLIPDRLDLITTIKKRMSLCPKWKNFWFNVQRLFLTNWVERSFEFRKIPFKPDSFRICFKSRKKSWGIPLPSTPLIKIQLEKLKHDVDCFGGMYPIPKVALLMNTI